MLAELVLGLVVVVFVELALELDGLDGLLIAKQLAGMQFAELRKVSGCLAVRIPCWCTFCMSLQAVHSPKVQSWMMNLMPHEGLKCLKCLMGLIGVAHLIRRVGNEVVELHGAGS